LNDDDGSISGGVGDFSILVVVCLVSWRLPPEADLIVNFFGVCFSSCESLRGDYFSVREMVECFEAVKLCFDADY